MSDRSYQRRRKSVKRRSFLDKAHSPTVCVPCTFFASGAKTETAPEVAMYWGIDLRGTKIEGVVLGADFLEKDSIPEPLCRIRVPTEADQGYQHILDRITELIREMRHAVGTTPEKLGFGTPGVLDPATNRLKNSNTVCLNGTPLKTDLERALDVPCFLANDANCFALAEHFTRAFRSRTSSGRRSIGSARRTDRQRRSRRLP